MINCNVKEVKKNLRYKILGVQDEHYIIDMDRSIWMVLFPFLNWFIAHKVYKMDEKYLEYMEMNELKQNSVGGLVILSAGLSIFLTTLLRPLMNELHFQASALINLTLLLLFILMGLFIRILLHKMFYKNMNRMGLYFESLKFTCIKIRPSGLYCMVFIILYLFLWGLAILFCVTFINSGAAVLLMALLLALTFVSVINFQAIRSGEAKMTFTSPIENDRN